MGVSVKLTFETTQTMTGRASVLLTQAPDYGRIHVELDGKTVLQEFNGYGPVVAPTLVDAGELTLEPGTHHLTITTLGKDSRSSGYFWGLDYLKIGEK